jgi:hypothetical protein
MSVLRCLQTVTAAAALFAVLGACGLAPARTMPRPISRPHPPGAEVTVRSLTGTWACVVQTPDGPRAVAASLVQHGDVLTGTLTIDGRTFPGNRVVSGRLGGSGHFRLVFGQSPETVDVHGVPDSTSDRITAWVTGVAPQPVHVTFVRQ